MAFKFPSLAESKKLIHFMLEASLLHSFTGNLIIIIMEIYKLNCCFFSMASDLVKKSMDHSIPEV